MKIFALLLILGFTPINLIAQNPNGNYNPYVTDGSITPSPLLPSESGGRGELSFIIGNAGTDPLEIFSDQRMLLTISLSNGLAEDENPFSLITGSYAGYFSWSYNNGTYTGIQVSEILPKSEGTIKIAFEVSRNTSSPGSNGFNVNITPSPYQNSTNIQGDDAVNAYTYTREATSLDVSESSRFSIFPNPSRDEIMVELNGESGSYLLEIVAANGSIAKQEIVELQGKQFPVQLMGFSPGLYHVRLTKGEKIYQENLIIVE